MNIPMSEFHKYEGFTFNRYLNYLLGDYSYKHSGGYHTAFMITSLRSRHWNEGIASSHRYENYYTNWFDMFVTYNNWA